MLQRIKRTAEVTYDVASLGARSVRNIGYAARRHKLVFKHLYEAGNRSLFIVSIMGCFIGLVLALQSAFQLQKFSQENLIGLVGIAIVKEFGPVITAFLLAGRIGSAYAAEIGTMKVSEEIDALKVTGIRPVGYLAAPRLLACVIMVPILTIYADFVAMLGGAFMAKVYADVEFAVFFRVFFQYMDMTQVWRPLMKCVVFGIIISITGCYFGFNTTGGAEGVGKSTTDSVVCALLAVLVSDYFMERILLAF